MVDRLFVVDSQYTRPRVAAIFVRVENGEAAVIETATRHSTPLALSAMESRGIRPEAVRYVIVTHAHLDHAGGAASLLAAFPNATLVAHPRAARHLIDPAKLEASARVVYGDAEFERLYGRLEPIGVDRVLQVEDGTKLPFGLGAFEVMHTRGHAKHHLCLLDPQADAIFTGDAFGLAYPDLQDRGLFVFPSTSPTDFEGAEALAAIDRIASCGARRVMLTHFGELAAIAEARLMLRGHVEFSMEIAESARNLGESERSGFLFARLRERYANELSRAPYLEMDLRLNADGLAWSTRDKAAAAS